MAGQVVHARMGLRAQYRPLRSPLAGNDSDPLRVVDALLGLHPFRRLYVADLDAIAGRVGHADTIAAIGRRHPAIELWVDRGQRDPAAATTTAAVPVLGTESLGAVPVDVAPSRWVLSLDFRGGRLLGAEAWLQSSHQWPDAVIAMTLDRVGSTAGPDLQLLRALRAAAPHRRLYAAGGVRDGTDLSALAATDVHGVLLASALHDGRIGRDDLRRFAAAG